MNIDSVMGMHCLMIAALLTGCAGPKDMALEAYGRQLAARQAQEARSMELYRKGVKAYDASDNESARSYLEDAIAQDDRNADAWIILAMLEFDEGDIRNAARSFHRAARLRPNRYEPHFNLGIVLEQAGLYSRAAKEFEKALELALGQIEIMESLAGCYIQTNDQLDRALELIHTALKSEHRPEWIGWLEMESNRLQRRRSDRGLGQVLTPNQTYILGERT